METRKQKTSKNKNNKNTAQHRKQPHSVLSVCLSVSVSLSLSLAFSLAPSQPQIDIVASDIADSTVRIVTRDEFGNLVEIAGGTDYRECLVLAVHHIYAHTCSATICEPPVPFMLFCSSCFSAFAFQLPLFSSPLLSFCTYLCTHCPSLSLFRLLLPVCVCRLSFVCVDLLRRYSGGGPDSYISGARISCRRRSCPNEVELLHRISQPWKGKSPPRLPVFSSVVLQSHSLFLPAPSLRVAKVTGFCVLGGGSVCCTVACFEWLCPGIW